MIFTNIQPESSRRRPYYRIKEYRGNWLIIKMPEDSIMKTVRKEDDARYIQELHNRILELEAEVKELKYP